MSQVAERETEAAQEGGSDAEATSPKPKRKPQKLNSNSNKEMAKRPQPPPSAAEGGGDMSDVRTVEDVIATQDGSMPESIGGRRIVPVHISRIKDRPLKVGEKDSSVKIKIELDLEVEVEIYARVKGDVVIGLM